MSDWSDSSFRVFRQTLCSIFQRSQLQETLNSHLFRLDALEKQLALENLDEDKREAMERELGEVKKLLQINYDALKELQMQQRSQIPFIFYVMGATMFCYLMWKMWTNPY